MTVSLGMPAVPPPVLAPRRPTRQIRVGKGAVGGGAPISVQSMTTTKTTDINATLQQIAELTAAGCDIVRVAVPSQDDADVLPIIAKKSQLPVIADIHFQPKYVFAAIEAGCAAVRVNPGNIRAFDDQVKQIAQAATDAGVSIRIGVNAGSLDKRLLTKYGAPTPEALVEKMLDIAKARPGETLVDLGSGDGRTVIAAARRGLAARGIEYNPDMVGYARQRAAEAERGRRVEDVALRPLALADPLRVHPVAHVRCARS